MGAAPAIVWLFLCGSVFSDSDRSIKPNGVITLEVGESSTITCVSMYPISWKAFYEFTGKYDVSYESKPWNERLYESSIHLTDVTNYYVGAYYCVYNDSLFDDVPEPKSVYVYVNDPQHWMVHTDLVEISGTQDYDDDAKDINYIIVPCKSTSDSIEVKLFKNNLEISNGRGTGTLSFDLGYKISKPDDSDTGEYECVLKQDIYSYVQSFYVSVGRRKLDAVYVPLYNLMIESETGHFGIEGEELTLQCSQNVRKGEQISITWNLPNADAENRWIYSDATTTEHPTRPDLDIAVSIVTITGLDINEDTGIYYCTQTRWKVKRTSDSIFIKILKKNQGLIEIYDLKETTEMADEVTWQVKYKGHPKPTLVWYNKYRNEIRSNHKYKVSVNNDNTMLKIRNLESKDSGIYTLKARNDLVSTEKQFTLNVAGCPQMSSGSEFVQEGKSAEFICDCIGTEHNSPIKLKWRFTQCNITPQWTDCDVQSTTDLNKNFTTHTTRLGQTSKLTLYSTKPGKVECVADHIADDNKVEEYLIISDIEKPFHIWGLADDAEINAGDYVSLICGASVYYYSSDLNWYSNNKPVASGDNILVETLSTEYSHRIKLSWNGIRTSNAGTYECRATTFQHEKFSQNKTLNIDGHDLLRKAEIIDTNLVGDEIERSVNKALKMICKMIGTPNPVVNWYKNGELIKNSSRIGFSSDRQTMYMKYVTVDDKGVFKCVGRNSLGCDERFANLKIIGTDGPKLYTVFIIVAIVLLILALIICIVYFSMRLRRERRRLRDLEVEGLLDFAKGDPDRINPELSLQEQVDVLPYDKDYEFPREKLKLGKQLGSGAFGVVRKGVAKHISPTEEKTTVAVKMLKRTASIEDIKALVTELKIMVHLGHHVNVVNLLGAVTKNIAKSKVMIIVEYCRFGNLQNFLVQNREHFIDQIDPKIDSIDRSIVSRKQRFSRFQGYAYNTSSGTVVPTHLNSSSGTNTLIRPTSTGECLTLPCDDSTRGVTTTDLVYWMFQVARGMAYLASRKVIHGDLSARNILLCENNVVKICDFGLSKTIYNSDVYKKRGSGLLPFRWLAIETISDNRFSTFSDVWAFGVVMWEVFSLGNVPYPGMDADENLYFKLKSGYRMDKPENATQKIYEIMFQCWNSNPALRPLFDELDERLKELFVEEHYVDLNQEYVDINTKNVIRGKTDYLPLIGAKKINNFVNIPVKPSQNVVKNYLDMKAIPGSSVSTQNTSQIQDNTPTIRNKINVKNRIKKPGTRFTCT